MNNDKEQLIALKKGQESAFRYFVDVYTQSLQRYIMRICFDRDISDDVLQHCFIKLWQSPPLFIKNSSIKSWLYRVAYHYIMDHFRAQKKMQPIDDEFIEDSEATYIIEPSLIEKIETQQLLKTLNTEQRTIIYLYYFEGYGLKEIANILHIHHRACESTLRRAKQNLYYIYQEQHHG